MSDFNLPSQEPDTTASQLDKLDRDTLMLTTDINIQLGDLREIRADIDNYSERLSKLRKVLTERVKEYDDQHKKYS